MTLRRSLAELTAPSVPAATTVTITQSTSTAPTAVAASDGTDRPVFPVTILGPTNSSVRPVLMPPLEYRFWSLFLFFLSATWPYRAKKRQFKICWRHFFEATTEKVSFLCFRSYQMSPPTQNYYCH